MSSQTKKPNPVQIGGYTIDCSVSESHTFEAEVTEFPVEQGSPVSDNVRSKPITVTITGIVSDTPIGKIADLRNSEHGDQAFTPTTDTATAKARGDQQSAPSIDALAALILIRDNRQPITISTSLQIFENMVLTSLEIPRDATTGAALRFVATFQQVTLVTNQRTTVRIQQVRTATPSGQAKNVFTKTIQNIIGATLVFTRPVSQRAQYKGYQLLSTDNLGDHYDLGANGVADGYLDTDHGNTYHYLSVPTPTPTAYSSTNVPATVNGRPVHYDYGTRNADGSLTPSGGTWVDDKSNSVVKTVPPGADRWSFVTSGFGNHG